MANRIRHVNDGIGYSGAPDDNMQDIRVYSEGGTVQLWCEVCDGYQTGMRFLSPEEALEFAEAFKRCAENAREQQKSTVTPEVEHAARKLWESNSSASWEENVDDHGRNWYYKQVRIVLESVRNPSPETVEFGDSVMANRYEPSSGATRIDSIPVWQTMIDAMLGKGKVR